MSMSKKKSNILEGNLAKNIIVYTIPTIFTGILQLLFNATDTVMVGHYAGHSALASVGATGALINLLVNVFMGLRRSVLRLQKPRRRVTDNPHRHDPCGNYGRWRCNLRLCLQQNLS